MSGRNASKGPRKSAAEKDEQRADKKLGIELWRAKLGHWGVMADSWPCGKGGWLLFGPVQVPQVPTYLGYIATWLGGTSRAQLVTSHFCLGWSISQLKNR